MEPNARNMFDVVLKRLDDMESRSSERWERWEKRCDDDAAARQTRDAAVDQRLGSLEAFVSAFSERAAAEDRRLGLLEQRAASEHRRVEEIDLRVTHLEDFAHAQYTTASVADSWGAHFNDRVSELDSRMKELELIRIYEIRDKRDECVSTVETVVADLEAWRPNVDNFIDDTRLKMLRLTK
jgi:DNA repair exonuclease SbcCD ATPase subunit